MHAPILPPHLNQKKKRKRRSFLLSFLGFLFGSGVLIFLAVSTVAGFLLWRASQDLPSYDSLAKYEPPVMTRIHAHDGSLMAEYSRERRIFVPINTVPKLLINAYLSAEDKRFYEHGGLDFHGIGRAGYKFILAQINRSEKRTEGASTITQQVAKNFLLSSDRTLERKIKEAILAIRIEKAYPKEKILELYLNEIYLGLGAYGVAGAALTYFGKELDQLSIEEVAFLAALPKAPNNYNPLRERTKARAVDRRNWIIGEMANNGFITAEQAKTARAKELVVNIRSFGTQIYAADYFAEEVRRSLVNQFGEDGLYGRSERTGNNDGRVNGGMSVRTTVDPKLQRVARRALIDGLVSFDRDKGWRGAVQKLDMSTDWHPALGAIDVPGDIAPWRLGVVTALDRSKAVIGLRPPKQADGKLVSDRDGVEIAYDEIKWANKKPSKTPGIGDVLAVGDVIWVGPKDPNKVDGVWSLMQIPEIGGGLVALDPHTGRVHAVAGGFSFATSQFDRALQAKRQPGSSFKPLVYAAALDNGYKPTSIVLDAPFCKEATSSQAEWCPKNYEGDKSYGPQTLRTGIEKSRNQMTVRLTEDLGMPLVVEYSKRFGVYDDLLPVLAMSLGSGETTLLRMTTAYAMLANGGKLIKPTLIDRIQDRWGKTVWRHDERECAKCKADTPGVEPDVPDTRKQIIDPHTAFQMTSIMEGVVQRGTGTRIKEIIPGVPVAGKTGTTNEEKDAWFIGYTADLVVGVFIGYDTPKPMGKGRTGGQIAAPIVGNFLKLALADSKGELKKVPFRQPPGIKFVRVNAKTGIRATADDKDTIQEYFKPFEDPDDAYSVIGMQSGETSTSAGAAGATTGNQDTASPRVDQTGRRLY